MERRIYVPYLNHLELMLDDDNEDEYIDISRVNTMSKCLNKNNAFYCNRKSNIYRLCRIPYTTKSNDVFSVDQPKRPKIALEVPSVEFESVQNDVVWFNNNAKHFTLIEYIHFYDITSD